MRRPATLYDIRHLLQEQLPHLPGRHVGGGHATRLERLPGGMSLALDLQLSVQS